MELRARPCLMIFVLSLATSGCGGRGSPVSALSPEALSSWNKKNKSDPNSKTEVPVEGTPSLNLKSPDGTVNYGYSAIGLTGSCLSGSTLELQGDVIVGKPAKCNNGKFEFAEFILSGDDGPKKIFVKQSEDNGSVLNSSPVTVSRETKTIFKIPEDALQSGATDGLQGDFITDIVSDGEHLVLSLRRGGFAISRDGGETWFIKSDVHGLRSGSAQKFLSKNGVFYATSSQGFFTSNDFGRSWTKKSDTISFTNTLHHHQERVFVDVGYTGALYSTDNGTSWKSTEPLPYISGTRTWTSLGQRLFINSRDGVHQYNPETNTWSLFTYPDLASNQRVISLEGSENLILAQVSNWPDVASTRNYTSQVSIDKGLTWTPVFSTPNYYEILKIVSGHLVRWSNAAKTFDVRISRDNGKYWSPLALPAAIANQTPVSGLAVFTENNSLLLRSRDRFAVTTDEQLTSWKSFEIPEQLRGSKLLKYRVFNNRRFLVFERGLLVSTPGLDKWSLLSVKQSMPFSPAGLTVQSNKIFSWSPADGFAGVLGSLYLSRDSGRSFENITARLKLLNGFYERTEAQLLSNGVSTSGYSNPVTKVTLSNKKIFVATPEGVAVSTDDAASFSFLQGSDGRPVPIANDVDVEASSVAIATKSTGLLLSKDEGENWTSLTTANGLPFNNPDQVSLKGEKVFISLGTNVAVSHDFGQTWRRPSFAQIFPNSNVLTVRFTSGRIILSLRKFVTAADGSNIAEYSIAVSEDSGETFVTMTLPSGVGRWLVAAHLWNNQFYLAGPEGVMTASLDLRQSQPIAQFPSELTGLAISNGAVYVSTFGGLSAIGGAAAVTSVESEGTTRRSSPIQLSECLNACPTLDAGTSPTASPSPAPISTPSMQISGCSFNNQTSRCDYTISWSNAPLNSCLWIQEQNASAVKTDCGNMANRSQGSVTARWLKPNTNYSLFLAKEVTFNVAGAKYIEKPLLTDSAQTQILIQPCSTFNHDFCTAKIEWKFAPASSCLWSIHPLTGEIFLAACATAANPNGNIINYPWMAYASANKFFLARQVAGDPNTPQPERYLNVDYPQNWPQNTPSYRTVSSLFCPDGACKNTVRGFVDSYANGTVQGWACKTGLNSSIELQIIAASQSTRTPLATVTANIQSEAGLDQPCGTNLRMHRFSFTIPPELRTTHVGKGIDVLAIDPQVPDGSKNFLLEKSGFFVID